MKRRILAMLMSLVLMIGILPVTALATEDADLEAAVFWYDFSDEFLSTVRTAFDAELEAAGGEWTNYDAQGADVLIVNIVETLPNESAQAIVDKAKAADIPVIFFTREVEDYVIDSYENACYVGTEMGMAGGMQGKMAADYILENYDKVDLNNDGQISYIMMKGELGNPEAEARTRYSVEFCNNALVEAGKPELVYYDENNTDCFQPSNWSEEIAFDLMTTALDTNPMDSEAPIEVVFANCDYAAFGCIKALNNVDYNTGEDKFIPVFGIDCTAEAMEAMEAGKMTGSVLQSAAGMAEAVAALVNNVANGENVFANADENFVVDTDGTAKIRVPYEMILEGEPYETDFDYDYEYDYGYDDWYDDFEGAEGECGDNLTWVLGTDGVLTISGEGDMWEYPAWNEYANYITDVIIEEGVASIGDYAFNNCWITRVELPESVRFIGDWAFSEGLMTLVIEGGNTTLSENALSNCWQLSRIIFEGDAPQVSGEEFYWPNTIVFYPEGNETWTEEFMNAYYGATFMSYDPENPDYSIRGECGDNLTWLLDKDGVLTISGEGEMWDFEESPWYDLSGMINSVVIEEGVTSIGDRAFANCLYVKYISIPDTVTSIGYGAISFMDSLSEVYIPASVTEIAEFNFCYCYNLTSIWVDEMNPNYSSDENGTLFDKDKTSLIKVSSNFEGCYFVPNGVTTIENLCFTGCNYLTSIVIPASVTYFDYSAFMVCENLKEIVVDENNTNYSSDENGVLFNKDKTELIKVPGGYEGDYAIPNGVTVIGYGAFVNCAGVYSISVPESVTVINDAFSSCYNLTKVLVAEENPNYSSDENGILYNKDKNELIYVPRGLGDVVIISDSVTSFVYWAFAECYDKEIVFMGDAPECDGYIQIGDATIYYPVDNPTWTEEVKARFGEYITWISYDPENPDLIASGECGDNLTWTLDMFGVLTISGEGDMYDLNVEERYPWYNQNLTEVIINSGVTSIGDHAFAECNMKTITIPDTVTDIGDYALYFCTELNHIWVDEDNPNYKSDERGVLHNKEMTELILVPIGITGNYTIQEGVEYINGSAFRYIGSDLESVTIPASVTMIAYDAFVKCNLTKIIVDEDNPYYSSDEYGVLYNKDKTMLIYAPHGIGETFTVPFSVNYIRQQGFWDCNDLIAIRFTGDAPICDATSLHWNTITVYYPANNPTWTEEVMASFGGDYITWAPYDPRPQGDVDGDGEISNTDLIMVARYIVELYDAETVNDIKKYGDMDGDEMITNADLIQMARIIVGLV